MIPLTPLYPPQSLLVTGTDTGVGKTEVSAALLSAWAARGHRVAGMKPVASGCSAGPGGLRNDDAMALIAASGQPLDYVEVNPYAFAPPIAPHLAAREAGVVVETGRILTAWQGLAARSEAVVVEGVGGWRVPLGEGLDFADLARALGLPVLLVVGLRLGCINHARLSAELIRHDGLRLVGWVACQVEPEMARVQANLETLADCLPAPCCGILPWVPGAGATQRARDLMMDRIT